MRAVKENREYTVVTDAEVAVYKARGFDIYDDKGALVDYGDGKKVSMKEYAAIVEENKKLKAELKKLKKELDAAKNPESPEGK